MMTLTLPSRKCALRLREGPPPRQPFYVQGVSVNMPSSFLLCVTAPRVIHSCTKLSDHRPRNGFILSLQWPSSCLPNSTPIRVFLVHLTCPPVSAHCSPKPLIRIGFPSSESCECLIAIRRSQPMQLLYTPYGCLHLVGFPILTPGWVCLRPSGVFT